MRPFVTLQIPADEVLLREKTVQPSKFLPLKSSMRLVGVIEGSSSLTVAVVIKSCRSPNSGAGESGGTSGCAAPIWTKASKRPVETKAATRKFRDVRAVFIAGS